LKKLDKNVKQGIADKKEFVDAARKTLKKELGVEGITFEDGNEL